jgi:hypothetical protein
MTTVRVGDRTLIRTDLLHRTPGTILLEVMEVEVVVEEAEVVAEEEVVVEGEVTEEGRRKRKPSPPRLKCPSLVANPGGMADQS